MVAEGQSSVTWRSRSSRGIFVGSHLLGHTTGYLGHWYWWVYVHRDKFINASIFYINMYCRSVENTYIYIKSITHKVQCTYNYFFSYWDIKTISLSTNILLLNNWSSTAFDWSVPVESPGQTPCYRTGRAPSVCDIHSSCDWPGSDARAGHHIYSHTTWPLICTDQSVAVPKNWNLKISSSKSSFLKDSTKCNLCIHVFSWH